MHLAKYKKEYNSNTQFVSIRTGPSFKRLAYFYQKTRGMDSDMLFRRQMYSTIKERFSYTLFPSSSTGHPAPSPTEQQMQSGSCPCSCRSFFQLFIHSAWPWSPFIALKYWVCFYDNVIQNNNLPITLQYSLILLLDFPFYFLKASLTVMQCFLCQKSRNEWTTLTSELAAKSLWDQLCKHIH